MPVSVTMPRLGESVTEGTVTRWLKQEGDEVTADEPLLEVSTDKVDTEVPSPASGVLTSIKVAEDETVEIGVELAVISEAGEASGSRRCELAGFRFRSSRPRVLPGLRTALPMPEQAAEAGASDEAADRAGGRAASRRDGRGGVGRRASRPPAAARAGQPARLRPHLRRRPRPLPPPLRQPHQRLPPQPTRLRRRPRPTTMRSPAPT